MEIIEKLNLIYKMADPATQSLIEVLIEYIGKNEARFKEEMGFKNENNSNSKR